MFCFKIDAQNFSIDHDELVITQQDTLRLFTKNITSNELMVIVDEYKKGVLDTWLDNWDKGHFFLAILNESSKEFFVYNDHMSSNDILYYADTQNVVISNDVKKIFNILNVSPEIDRDSVYEMIAFFSIVPPKTIYKNINAALLGSCLKYVPGKTIEVYKYWHPESLFKSKEKDYDNLILSVRNALIESFRDENEFEKMSISLSSGVDSGGLISMLSSVEKVSIPSITIGPYGPEYQDLKVAKKVAEYNHSPNHAIYPTIQDLKKMKEYVLGINLLIRGHFLLIVWFLNRHKK
jgi:asparagine synthetase B (glutamine-hydrolysing)